MSGERLTPFMLYYCEHKDVVQSANPSAAPHEISEIIADRWKALAPEKARAYSVLSASYTEQKKMNSGAANSKKRKGSVGGEKEAKSKEKDPKAPKSATSAYMYFSKHHRMLLKQENSHLTFGDLGKTVGAMWKAATPEEKRPFEELATEDKNRYLNELNDYRSLQNHAPPALDDLLMPPNDDDGPPLADTAAPVTESVPAADATTTHTKAPLEATKNDGNESIPPATQSAPPDVAPPSKVTRTTSPAKKKAKTSPRSSPASALPSSPPSNDTSQNQQQEPPPATSSADTKAPP